MSEDVTLKTLFGALQEEMVAQAKFSNVVNHPVDKGDNTEVSWVKWFNEYLPKRYQAAKATVIDSQGNISDQIDLVLYDGQYSYLAFKQNGVLYIPAESVYAVFEVKQDLKKVYMEYAGEKAESVRKLYRTSASIPYAGGVYPPKPLHRIIAGILTTSSDWKEPFGKPFRKCIATYTELQQVDCGCTLNGGAFYYDYQKNSLRTSNAEESLVYFFLQLLILLQRLGTVPAIDLEAYMQALTIAEDKI
ncbi:MAG: hypothetical protein IJ794_01635 [Lachnospiraceae bacterium]|nr:hypothetical protein [Lachnospiraceae bacterium]